MVVLLLAGQIGVGKSTIAAHVSQQLDASVLRVREALRVSTGADAADRAALQRLGADLDRRTNGRWLLHYLQEHVVDPPGTVIDAVRTRRQTVPLLEGIVGSRLVYLEASESTRRRRFATAANTDPVKRSMDFDAAMNHPTELRVATLIPLAHLVVVTDGLTVAETAAEVITALP